MAWSRSEPDPLKARRRQLAEQEKQLAQRMARLHDELRNGGAEPPATAKAAELPVWRMEEETKEPVAPKTLPSRPRGLGRQRQRDKVIFFVCIAFLVALLSIVFWVWKAHVATTPGG